MALDGKDIQMNKIFLMGRLTKDPDVRMAASNSTLIASYTLAVDRPGKDDTADFFSCTAFGKAAEFADRYLNRGMKVLITGHMQMEKWTDKDGEQRSTWRVYIDSQEFAESKQATGSTTQATGAQKQAAATTAPAEVNDGFMAIPDDVDDAGLPWKQ